MAHSALVLLAGILAMLFESETYFAWMSDPPVTIESPAREEMEAPNFEDYDVGETEIEPTELNLETLTQAEFRRPPKTAQHNDESEEFIESGGGTESVMQGPELGGLGGFEVRGIAGPAGRGGVGVGHGRSNRPGSGGAGEGFGTRGSGHRDAMVGSSGGTKASERAVGAALHWLFRHQNPNGSWSLQHQRRCTGNACSCPAEIKADGAATAMGVLPFLGAGQTHDVPGPYRQCVTNAVYWLMKHQSPNGDLSAGGDFRMYSHALATIALCESYGMTKDSKLAMPAQAAVRFIEMAQNPQTGGWRYEPGDAGDTSVTGWQLMALRSAQLAGLNVNASVIHNAKLWLQVVAKGEYRGLFSYQPVREVTPSMTAVGMLCNQYVGVRRADPAMIESKAFLLDNLPDNNLNRSVYYWYYGTLAMHNYLGPDWDAWNRRTRRALIETQARDGCAGGSWDPEHPAPDEWSQRGGRLTMTVLAALTLEIYYRYSPLFRVEAAAEARSELK